MGGNRRWSPLICYIPVWLQGRRPCHGYGGSLFLVVKHSHSWNSREDLTDWCLFCTVNLCFLHLLDQLLHWNTFCRFSLNASLQLKVSPAQHRSLKGSSFLKLGVEGLCFFTRLLLKLFWCVSSGLLNECCLETLYNSRTLETATGPEVEKLLSVCWHFITEPEPEEECYLK